MRKRFSVAAALAGVLALVSVSRPGRAAAPCDAKCRQDYRGNAAAINACIRSCGAGGPASPGARSSSVKSSKSNSSDRIAAPSGSAQPAEAVKSGKSNSPEREAAPTGPTPRPVEKQTTVKGTRSNGSSFRQEAPADSNSPAPGPAESINLNSSRSNSYRKAGSSTSGVVTSVDATARTISLRRKDGSVIVLDASKLTGGLPKVGQKVNVEYSNAGGNPTVVSIAVSDPGVPPDK